jgi:hypothetical protein
MYIDWFMAYLPDLKQSDQFGLVPMQGTVPEAFVGGGQSLS